MPGFINRIIFDQGNNTPTVDCIIHVLDFIKLSENLEQYLTCTPIYNKRASYLKGSLVMDLCDIQIYHIHKDKED